MKRRSFIKSLFTVAGAAPVTSLGFGALAPDNPEEVLELFRQADQKLVTVIKGRSMGKTQSIIVESGVDLQELVRGDMVERMCEQLDKEVGKLCFQLGKEIDGVTS